MYAGYQLKYLRFATGRHDLPFYTKESVELQKSFLDAFLKGEDSAGWSTGTGPCIELVVRKGDLGVNNLEAKKGFPTRVEEAWLIPRTAYTKYYIGVDESLLETLLVLAHASKLSYQAPSRMNEQYKIQFRTRPLEQEVEFTGHIVAHLNVSASAIDASSSLPCDINLFLTVRHLAASGKEISYTGADSDSILISIFTILKESKYSWNKLRLFTNFYCQEPWHKALSNTPT